MRTWNIHTIVHFGWRCKFEFVLSFSVIDRQTLQFQRERTYDRALWLTLRTSVVKTSASSDNLVPRCLLYCALSVFTAASYLPIRRIFCTEALLFLMSILRSINHMRRSKSGICVNSNWETITNVNCWKHSSWSPYHIIIKN